MDEPIFISYKRSDKDKVFQVKDYIESETGLSCWIDLDGIESDALFEDVIISAIDNCKVFLFFYSQEHTKINNYDDDWTLRELNYAKEEKKRIVFVNLDNTPLTKKFKFRYGQKQQVFVQDKSRLDRLVSDIKKWIRHESGEVVSEANVQEQSKLNKIIRLEYGDKKWYMVLSEDETFYIGNINSKEGDLSWLDSKWIHAIKGGALAAAAILYVLPVPKIIRYGMSLLSTTFAKNKNGKPSKDIIVDSALCDELSKYTGYRFSMPSDSELTAIKEDMRDGCIVLRINDNPKLFAESIQQKT